VSDAVRDWQARRDLIPQEPNSLGAVMLDRWSLLIDAEELGKQAPEKEVHLPAPSGPP
jgi:hypothetical protein